MINPRPAKLLIELIENLPGDALVIFLFLKHVLVLHFTSNRIMQLVNEDKDLRVIDQNTLDSENQECRAN